MVGFLDEVVLITPAGVMSHAGLIILAGTQRINSTTAEIIQLVNTVNKTKITCPVHAVCIW